MIRNPLKHLNRHRQMIALLYKYSRSDLVLDSGLAESFAEKTGEPIEEQLNDRRQGEHPEFKHVNSNGSEKADSGAGPENLARDLEKMGPTFIKLGQLLSTRPDFLPKPYIEALSRLQDHAEEIHPQAVFETVERELGQEPEYLFKSFDVTPIASASLGQVHRAITLDGKEVVVKVQRPDIGHVLHDDIEAMEEMASFCEIFEFGRRYQLKHLVESLKQSLAKEIDYLQEAGNAVTLADNLSKFDKIKIPLPIMELTTERVITLEFVNSEKITEISPTRLKLKDANFLADHLFKAFLYQVLVHGAFHADPHPGNIGLTVDDKVVIMDHGLVVKVGPRLQAELIKLLLAICDGNGTQAAEIAEKTGSAGTHYDKKLFREDIERIVAENINQSLDQLDAGTALMSIQRTAGMHDLYMPKEVLLLGRALMHLDRVVSALDERFDPNKAIRKHAMAIMREHSGQSITLSSVYNTLIESAEFVQQLPHRANRFADMLTNNELEIKVHTIDETKLINGFQKVANRIATGLIISAMIVAAALMMRIQTEWTIFGYPPLALTFLIFAGVAGAILIWRVVIGDHMEKIKR